MNSCSNCKHRKWFKILSTCILAEQAKENMNKQLEIARNPLSQYSTSQLKAELKRRKEK